MSDKLPEPYPVNEARGFSPFALRCNEIDRAALLVRDPDAFAELTKGDRVLDPDAAITSGSHAFLEKPNGQFLRHFTAEGGCPAFQGVRNAGSSATVLCGLTSVQLHNYCQVKFCEKGRRVYCPIWRAKGGTDNDDRRSV